MAMTSRDGNDVILKVFFLVAETMDKNVVTFDATDSVFNENTYLAQDLVFSLLLLTQLWIWILFALAWFLVGQLDIFPLIVGLEAKIAQVSKNDDVRKPIQLRREFFFQHLVVVVAPREGAPQEENDLVDCRNHGVFQRMSFFFKL